MLLTIGHHSGPKHPWSVPSETQTSWPLIIPLLSQGHWEEVRHWPPYTGHALRHLVGDCCSQQSFPYLPTLQRQDSEYDGFAPPDHGHIEMMHCDHYIRFTPKPKIVSVSDSLSTPSGCSWPIPMHNFSTMEYCCLKWWPRHKFSFLYLFHHAHLGPFLLKWSLHMQLTCW